MRSLTQGNPIKLILQFSIPLFVGRILQLFYSIADTRIVGVFLGENGIAAVGGTSTVADLMVDMMFGVTGGFAIIAATRFGAKDEKGLKKAAGFTFLLTALISGLMSIFSLIFADSILHILNVPAEIYDDARSYIVVIMAGLILSAMYNACAALLRAIGDSFTPLVFLIISVILNVFLDYSLIRYFHMGVAGAAFATIFSQGVSFILCMLYIRKKYPQLHFSKEDLALDKEMISKMLKAGFSMGFMSAFVSFGTVSLQTAINTLGRDIIVAHTAARKITMIFMLPFGVFGQALATYCGQNMGAGKYDRIKKGMFDTIALTWVWCILVIIVSNTIAGRLVTMVTGSVESEIIKYAVLYLRVDTAFYFVPTLIALIRNSLQGCGDATTPVISSFIEFAGKLLIALFLAPLIGYWGIIVAEPIVWVLMVIPLLISMFKLLKKYSV